MRFEWADEEKGAWVEAERGITLEDVKEAFADPNNAELYDEAHSESEDRYIVIGLSGRGLLTIVYTVGQAEDDEVYRIITAWHATTREERIYESEE